MCSYFEVNQIGVPYKNTKIVTKLSPLLKLMRNFRRDTMEYGDLFSNIRQCLIYSPENNCDVHKSEGN